MPSSLCTAVFLHVLATALQMHKIGKALGMQCSVEHNSLSRWNMEAILPERQEVNVS